MKNYTLFVDTNCDITSKFASKMKCKLISMPYVMDNKLHYPFKDKKSFNYKKYYNLLQEYNIPTTCSLSPGEYIEYFESEFKAKKDIIYIHFSSAMSSTFNAMRLALIELQEKYPERKFYEIDTKGVSILSYIIIQKIVELLNNDISIEEVLEWSKTEIDKFACYFFANDIKFFSKSGRISGLKGYLGSLIGIHPITTMDSEGHLICCDKIRGRNNAINKLVNYVEELGVDLNNQIIYIGHSNADILVEQLKTKLKQKFGNKLKFCVIPINPTIGAHCGPNTVGVGFYAKHR